MSYEVLARKYRPSSFDEVIGQDHVVKALINSIESEKIHQAFIFSGTRGVGKTTIARILAKCMNCESDTKPTKEPCNKCSNTIEITAGRSVDFLEIDAASNTQVEKIRELIESVEYKPAKGRYKVYLIDEVHMLSTQSFNALLKTLEEPPPHVIFIFATTNPEKIPKTVQSRCLQLNLKTVNENLLVDHLKKILKKENIEFDKNSIELIAKSADGSVRDSLTLLDQAIANGGGQLVEDEVKSLLGTIDDTLLVNLMKSVINGNSEEAFSILSELEELTPEYDILLKDLIGIIHQVSLEQALNNSEDNRIKEIAEMIDKEFCQLLYEIAINSYSKFSVHPDPKECLEICILRMLTFNPLLKLNNEENPDKIKVKEKKNSKDTKFIDNFESKISQSKPEIESFFLKNNDQWIKFYDQLNLSEFAKTYFGNMEFIEFKNSKLHFLSSEEFSEVPENIIQEFENLIEDNFNKKIKAHIKCGNPENTPNQKIKKAEENSKKESQNQIYDDKSIQNFVNKYNGKIKKESIKPLE